MVMSRFVVWSVSIVFACTASAMAQNKVNFDNQSGEPALVKLVGPTQTEVEVPNGATVGVEAAAGHYFIKVRSGMPGKYRYSKGDEFDVRETATTKSEITITLHKVIDGNYDSRPISEDEFGTSTPQTTVSQNADKNQVGIDRVRQLADLSATGRETLLDIEALITMSQGGKSSRPLKGLLFPKSSNLESAKDTDVIAKMFNVEGGPVFYDVKEMKLAESSAAELFKVTSFQTMSAVIDGKTITVKVSFVESRKELNPRARSVAKALGLCPEGTGIVYPDTSSAPLVAYRDGETWFFFEKGVAKPRSGSFKPSTPP